MSTPGNERSAPCAVPIPRSNNVPTPMTIDGDQRMRIDTFILGLAPAHRSRWAFVQGHDAIGALAEQQLPAVDLDEKQCRLGRQSPDFEQLDARRAGIGRMIERGEIALEYEHRPDAENDDDDQSADHAYDDAAHGLVALLERNLGLARFAGRTG